MPAAAGSNTTATAPPETSSTTTTSGKEPYGYTTGFIDPAAPPSSSIDYNHGAPTESNANVRSGDN